MARTFQKHQHSREREREGVNTQQTESSKKGRWVGSRQRAQRKGRWEYAAENSEKGKVWECCRQRALRKGRCENAADRELWDREGVSMQQTESSEKGKVWVCSRQRALKEGRCEYAAGRELWCVHSQHSNQRQRGLGHSPHTVTACPGHQGRGFHSGDTASLGPLCSALCQRSWLWLWRHVGRPQTESRQVTFFLTRHVGMDWQSTSS